MGYRANISVHVDWFHRSGLGSGFESFQKALQVILMIIQGWEWLVRTERRKGWAWGHPHLGKGEWASCKKERASEAGTWGQWEAVKGREELKEEGLYKEMEIQENNNRQIFGSYQSSQKKHWRKRRMSWGHISSIEEFLSADVIEPRDCSDFETRSPVKDNDRISSILGYTLII